MNDTTRASGMASNDGQSARMEGAVMAQRKSTGRTIPRNIGRVETTYDWPGSEFGIRRPYPTETALSWHEVNHFLKFGALQ